jgi:Obg family GTPase CgtA-like protein
MSVSGVLVDNKYEPISELCVKQTDITHPKYPVIDMHTHFGPMLRGDGYVDMYDTAETVEKLKKAGVRKVLTLELLWEKGYDRLLEKIHPYEDFILSFGSVDYSRLDEPGFESMVWKTVNDLKSKGAKGLKIWKDLTFYMKDKSDQYIPVDDLYSLDETEPFEVTKENGEYILSGPAVDKLLGRVNLDDYESLQYFQRALRKLGMIDALREQGIGEGDTVRMGGWSFDFVD